MGIGRPQPDLLQGNHSSGLVCNVFSDAMDQCSTFKHDHDQHHPSLICPVSQEGLEVKATIPDGQGGESHNGHSGCHTVVRFERSDAGIQFVQVMFAMFNKGTRSTSSYCPGRHSSTSSKCRTTTYDLTLTRTMAHDGERAKPSR